MNEEMRKHAAELRKLPSGEIAKWLMTEYPLESAHWGDALILLEHVSLKKNDAGAIARYYLSGLPHASDRAYRVFVKLLSLDGLIDVVQEYLPTDRSRRDLLFYHLDPIIREHARSAEHVRMARLALDSQPSS